MNQTLATAVTTHSAWTALHCAAMCGRNEVVQQLMSFNPALFDMLTRPDGHSALHIAAAKGKNDVVHTLLNLRPELLTQVTRDRGLSILHLAALNGHFSLVEELIAKDRNLTRLVSTDDSFSPLYCAAINGDVQLVELLIKADPSSVDATTRDGRNALHFACLGGKETVVAMILSRAPHLLYARSKNQSSALHCAAMRGHTGVIKQLIDLVKPNQQDECKLLQHANDPQIQTLLDATTTSANKCAEIWSMIQNIRRDNYFNSNYLGFINGVRGDGRTALHMAANEGHTDAVIQLLQASPSLLIMRDNKGDTALHCAAANGHLFIVDLLLLAKPDMICFTNNSENTILHLVTSSVMLDQNFLNSIWQKKPQYLRAVNTDQQTPFHVALCKQNMSAIELFQWPLTFDDITDALQQTNQIYTQFEQVMRDQCVSLNSSLLPDITNIVFEYLGFDNTPKNSKKQKTN